MSEVAVLGGSPRYPTAKRGRASGLHWVFAGREPRSGAKFTWVMGFKSTDYSRKSDRLWNNLRRHCTIESPVEIRRTGVGELVSAGGAGEIGHGGPVQQTRRGLDGVAAPGLANKGETQFAVAELRQAR